jgi:hypothetical protein
VPVRASNEFVDVYRGLAIGRVAIFFLCFPRRAGSGRLSLRLISGAGMAYLGKHFGELYR